MPVSFTSKGDKIWEMRPATFALFFFVFPPFHFWDHMKTCFTILKVTSNSMFFSLATCYFFNYIAHIFCNPTLLGIVRKSLYYVLILKR